MSLQRALLGEVDPVLRGVLASWDESSVTARFIYDTADPSAFDETVREVEAEVVADMPVDVKVEFIPEACPAPAQLDAGPGVWAYLRREARS